jgi:hypothetical protein
MKKTYIRPTCTALPFYTEGMIAASAQFKTEETSIDDETSILSRRRGWDSDNWSNDNDE